MQDEFKMTETVEKLQTVYYFGRKITQEPLYVSGKDFMQKTKEVYLSKVRI